MKKFAVFAYYESEPAGGMNDYQGSYDTLDQCIVALANLEYSFDRQEIWDMDSEKCVYKEKGSF